MAYSHTPTYIGKGAFQSGLGALTVPVPSGFRNDDILIIIAESANQAITVPTGWAEVGAQASQATGTAAAAGGVRLAVFWKLATGAEPSVTIADSGDHTTAIMFAIRGADPVNPFGSATPVSRVDSTATTSMSWGTLTTTTANNLILMLTALDADAASTAAVGNVTAAGLTSITEIHDQTVTSGAGGGVHAAYGIRAAAGAIGTMTATGSTSTTHGYLTLAVQGRSDADIVPRGQYKIDLTTPVATGGNVINTNDGIYLVADISPAWQTDNTITPKIEVQPTSTAFTGTATVTNDGFIPESSNATYSARGGNLIHDEKNNRYIFFGGYDGTTRYNNVWAKDMRTPGRPWRKLSPSGTPPTAKNLAGAVYVRGTATSGGADKAFMVIWGGNTGASDTNEMHYLDVSTIGSEAWGTITQTSAPTARSYITRHFVATPVTGDASQNYIYFFGGWATSRENQFVRCTFDVDSPTAVTWTTLKANGTAGNPSARSGTIMDYKSSTSKIYIYGGYDGTTYLTDFWEYDIAGNTFSQRTGITGTAPTGTELGAGGYDSTNNRFWYTAGWSAGTQVSGQNHVGYIGSVGSGESYNSVRAADTDNQHYAGHSSSANLFDKTRGWIVMCGMMTVDSTERYSFVIDTTDGITSNKPVYGLNDGEFMQPRDAPASVYDSSSGSWLVMSGFSGMGDEVTIAGGTHVNDIWSYNQSTNRWRYANKGYLGMPHTEGLTAVYDSTRNRIVAFGGLSGVSETGNEVWSATRDDNGLYQWAKLNPTGTPPVSRWLCSGVFDSANNRAIFALGGDKVGPINEVWELSFSSSADGVWTQRTPTGSVTGVIGPGFAAKTSNTRLYIHGGATNAGLTTVSSQLIYLDYSTTNCAWTTPTSSGGTARRTPGLGYDATNDRLITFAGFNGSASIQTLQYWNVASPGAWSTSASTAVIPDARRSLGYTFQNGLFLITHGRSDSSPWYSGTWQLSPNYGTPNSSTWTELYPRRSQPHYFLYDPNSANNYHWQVWETEDSTDQTKWSFPYTVSTNTYYFDASDGGPTDAGAVFTNNANAFDGSTSTSAHTSTTGSTSSNFLIGYGTTAPTSGGKISQVRARIYMASSGSVTNPTMNATIYTADLTQTLGTATGNGNSGAAYYAYVTLTAPTAGWDWPTINNLAVKLYQTGGNGTPNSDIYRVEIEVTTVSNAETTAIAQFISSAAAEANTLTMPTHQTGDLLVMWAARDDSTTPPTVPSGWTQPSSPTNTGTLTAMTVAYKFAASGSETSGTWTNALALACNVYRGIDTTTPMIKQTGGNGTSTTVNYSGITTMNNPGVNWGVRAGIISTTDNALNTAPSSFTNRASNASPTNMEIATFDTNGPTSAVSFTGVSVGGSSGNWVTQTIELQPAIVSAATDFQLGGTASYTQTHTTDSLKRSQATKTHTTDSNLIYPISRLSDKFNSGSFSSNWSTSTGAVGGSDTPSNVTNTSNQVQIVGQTNAYYNGLFAVSMYDMTGGQASVQVTDPGDQTIVSHEAGIAIFQDNSNKLWTFIGDGVIKAYKLVAGSQAQVGSNVTFNSSVHKYLRIRESGGTWYYDYSTDGISWTNFQTLANPFSSKYFCPNIYSQHWQAETTASHAYFDNFNVTQGVITHSTDANKKKAGNTSTHTTDAYTRLGVQTFTKTHTTDALKRQQFTKTHTTDANKKKAGLTLSHTTDANKKKTLTVTHTTDSLKRKQNTLTHTTDANKKVSGNTRTHTTDSLKRKQFTKTHTTDSFLRASHTLTHSTDSNKRKALTVSHTTDSNKKKSGVAVSHTTDANKKKSFSVSHTTDSLKRLRLTLSHTTDANKKKSGVTVTHTTDAYKTFPLLETLQDNFNDNSVNTSLWSATDAGGLPFSRAQETNSRFEIELGSSATGVLDSADLGSVNFYSLVSSYVRAKVVSATGGANRYGDMIVLVNGGTSPRWSYNNGQLLAQSTPNGGTSRTTYATLTYNSSTHLYWRIRESGGAFYWDTSSDGTNWTNQYSGTPTGFTSPIKTQLYFEGGATGSGGGSTLYFDDVNIGKQTLTKTHTTDSLLRKQVTVSHTTDANRRKALSVSHTTDSNKKKTGNTVFHTTDANKKRAGLTLSHTTDANKKVAGNTRTHTTDALKRQQFAKTHTTDSLKRKSVTLTHTTDSFLRSSHTLSHTTDSNKKRAYTVSHTTDTNKKKSGNTVVHTTDSLKRKSNTLTHTTDVLKRSQVVKTHTTDALIRKSVTKTHTTDANRRKAFAVSHTTDANKKKAGNLVTHTTDALKRKQFVLSHTTDSLKRQQFVKTHTTDALKRVQITKTHTTDANKRKATLVSHTTDANRKKSGNLVVHTTDANKKKAGLTRIHTTDALLRQTHTLSHTTDSNKRLATIKTHLTDSFLRSGFMVNHNTDANKRKALSVSHTTDANKKKSGNLVTHTTDALKRVAHVLTHTTDALKRKAVAISHTTDSLLRKQFTKTHTTDSLKRKAFTLTQTTDSLKRKANTIVHTTDANRKKPTTVFHTTDANKRKSGLTVTHTTSSNLRKAYTIEHSTDANKKKSGSASHTTDANKRKSFSVSHSTDSLKRKSITITHTTDSFLRSGSARTHTTDANKRKATIISHTTDSFLHGANSVVHSTDANKKKSNVVSHSTDASKKVLHAVLHTTDANKKRSGVVSHSTDSNKKKSGLVSHSTDAFTKNRYMVFHATDSFLRKANLVHHSTDANKKRSRSVSHSTDASISGAFFIAHSTDAFIFAERGNKHVLVNGVWVYGVVHTLVGAQWIVCPLYVFDGSSWVLAQQ